MANINKLVLLKFQMVKVNIQNNINLLNYTTIKVGAQAKYFSEPANISELVNVINWAKQKKNKLPNFRCRIKFIN